VDEIIKAYYQETNLTNKVILIDLLGRTKTERAIKILKTELTNTKDDFIRQAVIEALSLISTEEAINIMIDSLEHDPAANVRFAAANGLRWVKSNKKVKPLITALRDADPLVRAAAAWSLGTIEESEDVLNELLEVLKTEKDEYVQYDLIKALGEIGSEKAVPILRDFILRTQNQKIQMKAIEAIGLIGTLKAQLVLLELYQKTFPKTLCYSIEKHMKHLDDDISEEFLRIKKEITKRRKLQKAATESQTLLEYQVCELKEILTSHRSISMDLLQGLLKINDGKKLYQWITTLPANLGLRLVKGYEYDSVLIQMPSDPKTLEKKVETIVANFKSFFKKK